MLSRSVLVFEHHAHVPDKLQVAWPRSCRMEQRYRLGQTVSRFRRSCSSRYDPAWKLHCICSSSKTEKHNA